MDPSKLGVRQGLPSGPLTLNNEIRFRSLLEKLPAGAYTCNPEGLITYFNQHAAQLWGRTPKLNDPEDRFCGSYKLFDKDGTPVAHDKCWMALALKDRTEYNGYEIVIERPDGQRLTGLAHANPIHDEAGELVGAVNVVVDISDRKRAEDSLKQADRSKNEFLATLAHELRNPLAPIRAAVRILQMKTETSAESRSVLGVIERQTQQMTRLIDDLLNIARITSNKLELRKRRINLADVINTAVETSRPLIDRSRHTLTVTMPPEPISLDGDMVRLAQVISNLLNNAAKYTEPGGQILLSAEKQAGDKAVVKVSDNGIGIAAEALPRIFDMFSQEGQVVAAAPAGLGIGLTLVKRLVELHGGSITAYSAGPGEGSEFVVRLPADASTAANHDLTNADVRNLPMLIPTTNRILVVDDNSDCADSLGLLLQLLGNEVRVAHAARAAIEVANEFGPRVVLLDIGLPTMNGYEVARKMKEQPWARNSVLIAVTGWGEAIDRQRSKEAGFDHHLVKPVDPDALATLLSSLNAPAE
jgi:PAS domain S-box-containing protein